MAARSNWSDLISGDRTRAVAAANTLLPFWVSLVIVALIGWKLASIIWTLIPGSSAGAPIAAPGGPVTSVDAGGSNVDVSAIASAHLFGEASEDTDDTPALVSTEVQAETTDRSLALRGTIASDKPEYSVAIIAVGSNDEKVFVVGDAISSGKSLHAVYTDHVVLNERGALTRLSLPREFEGRPAAAPRRQAATRRATTASNTSIQSVVASNVSRLADVIRPTPYFVNGQQQGYRVYPGRNRQQFSALGLRPGDLIKDIDGQALNDPTQAMQIFQSLGTASQVSVTVERNGTPETIILKTDQLDLGKEQTQ